MTPGLIALLAGPAILLPLAGYALTRRKVRGATWYAVLLLSIAVWNLAYAWELSAEHPDVKALALKIKYVGVVLLPSAWLGFILAIVGVPRAPVWRRVVPVACVSAVMLLLAWTDALHGWFWGPLTIQRIGEYEVLRGRGPFFWVNVLYTYAILVAGIVLLVSHAVHSPYLYKNRARLLIVGAMLPWLGNLTFVIDRQETIVDPTPFLFSCTAVVAALAVFRYELFEPAPTLRDARIESVGDGVILLDARQRVADLNPAAEGILGRSRSEAAGAGIAALLPGWSTAEPAASAADITIGSGAHERIYDVRCNELRSRAGERTGSVIVLRDVTERRAAEGALRASEQRYRTVFDQAFDGLCLTNRDDRIIEANPGACAILGYRAEELIGQRTTDLMQEVPRDEDTREGKAGEWERRALAKDGRAVLLAGRSRAIGADLVLSTFRDITRERAEADDRERLLVETQAANRLKDEFLATLSHELRTPLTAVLGWTRMLVRGAVRPERVRHALGVIERNTIAQARLVDDLLDMSAIARGRMRLKLANTDLATVVRDAVDAVRHWSHAKDIRLRVELSHAVPGVTADAERLRQVVWNLLTNAIKFTPPGGTVTISSAPTPDGVMLAVRDTGRGIAPEFLPFVFDPFRQGESGSTRTTHGLGLGLAIVLRIVEAHGGHVEAASDGPGRGATLRVYLPAARGVGENRPGHPAAAS